MRFLLQKGSFKVQVSFAKEPCKRDAYHAAMLVLCTTCLRCLFYLLINDVTPSICDRCEMSEKHSSYQQSHTHVALVLFFIKCLTEMSEMLFEMPYNAFFFVQGSPWKRPRRRPVHILKKSDYYTISFVKCLSTSLSRIFSIARQAT